MLYFKNIREALQHKTHCYLCNQKINDFNFELQPYKKTDKIEIIHKTNDNIQFDYISEKFYPYHISYDLDLNSLRFDYEIGKRNNELKDYSKKLSAINSSVLNRAFFIELHCENKIHTKFLEPMSEYACWIDVQLDLTTETISKISLDGEYYIILQDEKIYEITLGHPSWVSDKEYCVISVAKNTNKNSEDFSQITDYVDYKTITSNNVMIKGKQKIIERIDKIFLLK